MGKKKNEYSHLTAEEKKVITIAEIIQQLIKAHDSKSTVNLNVLKGKIAAKYGLETTPRLVDIIAAVPQEHRKTLVPKLMAKPIRTASGIAIVAVMCKPHRCPHINFTGNICVYCPGGPDSDFEYSTQSYTGYEPTSMRAIRARYDPYIQTRHRVEQLKQLGHNVDKVEFIVMGGTFMSLPDDYRDYFIRNLHDALSGHKSSTVEEAIKYSERANSKCIGITIETRPDYCLEKHLSDMLSYGCTRLEIGVQSVYEHVAKETNRGHTVSSVCETFCLAKDAGFKVVAHMMPNLPNVDLERDLSQFVEFFESPSFRADGLKIYPTLVIRGTGLYELWKTGRYKSYPPSVLVDLVAKILALIPPWTRVYRVQRDIPMPLVSSGVEHGNLRELALARMQDLGLKCRDVRTREVGITQIHQKVNPNRVEFIRRDYAANGGSEVFLSYEDPEQDILIGLLRLRKCTEKYTFRPELKGGVSIIRELHVYGSVVPVSERSSAKFQHQGYGILLVEQAERIAIEEHKSNKMAIISGIGTRNYYRKLGYEVEGPYMVKSLLPGVYMSYSDMLVKRTCPKFNLVEAEVCDNCEKLAVDNDETSVEVNGEKSVEDNGDKSVEDKEESAEDNNEKSAEDSDEKTAEDKGEKSAEDNSEKSAHDNTEKLPVDKGEKLPEDNDEKPDEDDYESDGEFLTDDEFMAKYKAPVYEFGAVGCGGDTYFEPRDLPLGPALQAIAEEFERLEKTMEDEQLDEAAGWSTKPTEYTQNLF